MRKSLCILLSLAAGISFFDMSHAPTSATQTFSISGKIVLDGRDWNLDVTLWLDPDHIEKTSALGDYSFHSLAPGEYIIRAYSKYCLPQIIDTVQISVANVTDVDDTLVVGDAVEDGRINLLDAGRMIDVIGARPDSSNWEYELDFYRDSVIDSLDVAMLMRHWKESGDSPLPPTNITVLEPNSTTMWYLGQENVEILWDPGDFYRTVSIDLYKGSNLLRTITSSTENDGSYTEYDVPLDMPPGKDCRVRVNINDYYFDASDWFEIRSPLEVTNPSSSTIWYLGQQDVSISWNTGDLSGNVSIDLYKDDNPLSVISASTPNDGDYTGYDIPFDLDPGSTYRVRVFHSDYHNDNSDNFTIEKMIEVFSPNGTNTWLLGQQDVQISWSAGTIGGMVSIDLYQDGSPVGVIASSTPNDGEYIDYDVPLGLEPGSGYQVHVFYDETYYDYGDSFKVSQSSEWFWLHPLPQGNTLNSVARTGANNGIAVGVMGTILRTTDGGATWVKQASNTLYDLLGVSFSDALTGTAVGANGVILKTTDGGVTWFSQLSGTDRKLRDVGCINETVGTAVGDGTILRTTNGGTTWVRQAQDLPPYYDLYGVSFSDPDMGTAVLGDNIYGIKYQTTDGGATWVEHWFGEGGDPGYFYYLHDVSLMDPMNRTAVGSWFDPNYYTSGGAIYRTDDGGSTWNIETRASGSAAFYGVTSVDGNVWIVGTGGTISQASYGASYSEMQTNGATTTLYDVSFTDVNTGTAVGLYGYIVGTQNGGATWENQSIAASYRHLRDIQFIDSQTGTAVGDGGTILRTADGGFTWIRQNNGVNYDLYGVSFTDADTGTAVGFAHLWGDFGSIDEAYILRTTNGGETWVPQWEARGGMRLYSVLFTDANTGTAVGGRGLILRTTDGGATWVQQTSGVSIELYDVVFTDADTGTAVGNEGTIIRTADGGETWVQQWSLPGLQLRSVEFMDTSTGTVVGYSPGSPNNAAILRTTDGGGTWVSQYSDPGIALSSVSLWGENRGVAVGANGRILTTIDGGATWTRQSRCTWNGLYGVYMTDENTVTAVGDGGTIIRTTTGLH